MTNDQNAIEREAKIFDNFISTQRPEQGIHFTHEDVGKALGILGHEGRMNRIKRWIQSGFVTKVVNGQYAKYFWKGITK